MKTRARLIWASVILFLSITFLPTISVKAADTDPLIRATDYQIAANLDPHANQLEEKVTINVQNNSSQPVRQLLLRNIAYGVLAYDRVHYPRFNRQRRTIVNGVTENKQYLSYQEGQDKSNLDVDLPAPLMPGKNISLTIAVTTDIPYRRDRFGFQKVRGGKIYNLSFCFPYLSDYRNGHWNYHPYSDEGENRNSAVANYQVTFTAPADYKVAASGNHVTRAGTTIISAPNIRDLAIVASNRFQVSHVQTDGIEINNYYLLGKKKRNSDNYNLLTKQTAADCLNLFSAKYGRYPYQNLDITEYPFDQDTGGMEYSGLIMVSDEGLLGARPGNLTNYYNLLQDVSHEVAHQWFFGIVGNDEYEEPWLDEGMAEFSEDYVYGLTPSKSANLFYRITHQVKEKKQMAAKARKIFSLAIKKMIVSKKRSPINYPMDKLPAGKDEEDIAYDRAKIFYAELMVAMGQKKFDQAMRDYCCTYYLKQATGQDFLAIIRRHDDSATINRIIRKFIITRYLQ